MSAAGGKVDRIVEPVDAGEIKTAIARAVAGGNGANLDLAAALARQEFRLIAQHADH